MRIGELATAAGTTTRAVRHYHSVGLMPEPGRHSNGYRVYSVEAVLRLVRIRRLRQLGLTVPEIRDALSGPDERELREVLAELVTDLDRQVTAIRDQRERLVTLLAREQDLAVLSAVAEILSEVRRQVPDQDLVDREGQLLELLEATTDPEQFAQLAGWYQQVLGDPQQVARGVALGQRFQALAELDPGDPEVAEVAAEFVALGRESLPSGNPDTAAAPPEQTAVWAAYQDSLAPVQQRCLTLAEQQYAS